MIMNYARPDVASMQGYIPGFQPDHRENYIKLNSNENPFPPSPKVKEALARMNFEDLRIYPDPLSLELRQKLGALYGFSPAEIICGNGSDDILNIIVRTFVRPGEMISFHEPTFPLYKILGTLQSASIVPLPMEEPFDNPPFPPGQCKVFFLANPNSPVGFFYPTARIREFAEKCRGILVVDEAYSEFARENALALVHDFPNVIVVRTVSKSYSLAGVRLGYALAGQSLIAEMLKVKDPFNVTRMTQALVVAALADQEYVRENIRRIIRIRDWFSKEITALGYRVVPSQGNFIFPQAPQKGRGVKFYESLLEHTVLTRYYDVEGLRDGVRMTIGKEDEMKAVIRVMTDLLPDFRVR
jgi:histidinol-phosphate aminotransferase